MSAATALLLGVLPTTESMQGTWELVQSEGPLVLLIPVSGGGSVAPRSSGERASTRVATLLAGFCVLALASVGWFYLPAAVLMIVAAVVSGSG
ncbi:hypothetical protein [Actinocorallia lasiicapitis]